MHTKCNDHFASMSPFVDFHPDAHGRAMVTGIMIQNATVPYFRIIKPMCSMTEAWGAGGCRILQVQSSTNGTDLMTSFRVLLAILLALVETVMFVANLESFVLSNGEIC